MPVPIEFLRGVLLVLCLFFGYQFGRAFVRVRRGQQKQSTAYAWFFRTLVCAVAITFRHRLDFIDIAMMVLTAGAIAGGAWQESRPPKEPDDLSKKMFE